MKKYIIAVSLIVAGFIGYKVFAAAGTQYNWGTSTGSSWITPDDTLVKAGQALQIGSSAGASVATTALPLGLFSASSTTFVALLANTTGQIGFCNNCTQTILVISTGSTTTGQWVGVFTATAGVVQPIK